MRGLITLTLLAAFGWSAWWFIGSSAQKTAIENWLDQQQQAGWVAESETLTVNGFPNRFDTVLTDLELSDPHVGWSWLAPEFQILSLSYKPNHIIAVWPGEHVVSTPEDSAKITSDRLRGSVIFKPETSLALARVQLEIENMVALGANDWQASVQEANVAFFADDTAPDANTYNLFIKATDITPPENWRGSARLENPLPETIPETLLDASLIFDHPWDRFAVEGETPLLTALRIRDLRFIWGALELRGVGEISVNSKGFADGDFTIQARNWRDLLQVFVATEILTAKMAETLEKGLAFIARSAGNPETIEIPLRFAKNRTYLGILPIGTAPQFYD